VHMRNYFFFNKGYKRLAAEEVKSEADLPNRENTGQHYTEPVKMTVVNSARLPVNTEPSTVISPPRRLG